jgi:hypothetical protein
MQKNKKEFSLSRADRYNRKERNAGKIVIYTEGDVTEPEYLNDWIRAFAIKNKLKPNKVLAGFEIVSSNNESEPLKIVENLIEDKSPKTSKLDKFYAVFDEDDRSNTGKDKENYQSAFKIAGENHINVICSNRSVELWAVLHFSDATPMTQKDLEKELKKFMPQYNSGKNKRFDFVTMVTQGNEDNAIRRAKALRKNNETSSSDWKVRPSTNFDELIEEMKKFILKR